MEPKRPIPSYMTVALADLARRQYRITQVPMTVGRRDCDLNIDHASVSGKHATLDIVDGKLVVTDLGSSNGTSVNGFKITAPTPLKDTDEVMFGLVLYHAEILMLRDAPVRHRPQEDPNNRTQQLREIPKVLPIGEERVVSLMVMMGGKQRQFILEKRITSVGRQECDVTLDDPALSRKHMQIEVYSDHFGLKDLASANGTFVNGKPISYLKVPGEVTFTAGGCTFQLSFTAK